MQEYASRVAYCIPILADSAICYDVAVQQTPEMQKEGKPPGVNLADKLLNEPGQPERQCVVIRVETEDEVGHASAVLLDTLRCRADATAERLGPEHEFALLALSRLAYVLEARGALAEAEPLRRRELEALERQLGPEHRATLIAVNNLALVLMQLGKFSEAEALHRRALAGREAHLGALHTHTLTSMSNLAAILWKQGKLDEAEELQCKALAGHEAQLGASHPETLIPVNVLACILESQGKLEEAEGLHRRALEGFESQLGPQHPDTLTLEGRRSPPPSIGRPRVPIGSPTPRHARLGEQLGHALEEAGQVGGGGGAPSQGPDGARRSAGPRASGHPQLRAEFGDFSGGERLRYRGRAAFSPQAAWPGGAAWAGARRDPSESPQPGAIPTTARAN